jgi:hypothetical protein
MKSFAIAFAAVVLYAGAAFAGPACEGTVDPETGPACGACVMAPSGDSTTGCIAVEDASMGYLCVGGDATTGQGCLGGSGEPGSQFICNTADGPAPCDEAGCRAAAAAACGG